MGKEADTEEKGKKEFNHEDLGDAKFTSTLLVSSVQLRIKLA